MAELDQAIETGCFFARKVRDPAFAASILDRFPPAAEIEPVRLAG